MKRIVIMLALIVSGCGPEIVSKDVIERGEPYETVERCTHYSYCYTCVGFGGCKFKMSAFCSGERDAVVRDVLVRYKYDNDTYEVFKQKETVSHGDCK